MKLKVHKRSSIDKSCFVDHNNTVHIGLSNVCDTDEHELLGMSKRKSIEFTLAHEIGHAKTSLPWIGPGFLTELLAWQYAFDHFTDYTNRESFVKVASLCMGLYYSDNCPDLPKNNPFAPY